jgi:alpha-amylase
MNKAFQTVDWALASNIYEVNIRQYTPDGTFSAFQKELPRLQQLGIRTIWFMPITPISVLNRKGTLGSYYACSDYTSVNPEFGTLDDFKNLVRKAQQLGMKVMIDWVANHTGWDHVWTKTHPEFFSMDDKGSFRPPFPDWEDVIHLNYENRSLWTAMIDAMKFWIEECDLDGYRCDMAHLVPLAFWIEARTELDKMKPLFWLGEMEDPRYHEVFDASYSWELLHTMERYWRKEANMSNIDNVFFKYSSLYPKGAIKLLFTSNHDENSHSGSEYERMGDAAQAFAVLCITWEGLPLIYSGQELPLVNKRLLFFERDPIPWTAEHKLDDFYKILLNLRSTNPALRAADDNVRTYRLETTDNADVFAFLRKNGQREVLVILNLSGVKRQFKIIGKVVSGKFRNVFSGSTEEIMADTQFVMEPWRYLVYEK